MEVPCLYTRNAKKKRSNWKMVDGTLKIRGSKALLYGAEGVVAKFVDEILLEKAEVTAIRNIGWPGPKEDDAEITLSFGDGAAVVYPKDDVPKKKPKIAKFRAPAPRPKPKPLRDTHWNDDAFETWHDKHTKDDWNDAGFNNHTHDWNDDAVFNTRADNKHTDDWNDDWNDGAIKTIAPTNWGDDAWTDRTDAPPPQNPSPVPPPPVPPQGSQEDWGDDDWM